MKVGVMIDSFKIGVEGGIRKAAQIGAEGIQMYATNGSLSPDNMDPAKRKDLLKLIKQNNLVVSALCGDMGGHGFAIAKDNPERIIKSKKIVDLAVDLETAVVTTHIGVIPPDPNHPRYSVLAEAMHELGIYAESKGVTFAIETGPETCKTLNQFIRSLGTKGIGVNMDPANLVMVTGDDPVAGVGLLGELIVHTHAKDGIRHRENDPEQIYNAFAGDGIEGMFVGEPFSETPLGEGQVDFDRYLKALRDIGYDGFLTIEREVGEDPEKDIVMAVEFLRKKL